MEQVFQAWIDRSPVLKDRVDDSGLSAAPQVSPAQKEVRGMEVAVEKPTTDDLTICKLHCGKLTLKIYATAERVLRIEVVVHNTQKLRCGRSLENFPAIVVEAHQVLERFMQAWSCIDQSFIATACWNNSQLPRRLGKPRSAEWISTNCGCRWAIEAVIALAPSPRGLTAPELAGQVRVRSHQSEMEYGARHATYDLKKLRGRLPGRWVGLAATHRYPKD